MGSRLNWRRLSTKAPRAGRRHRELVDGTINDAAAPEAAPQDNPQSSYRRRFSGLAHAGHTMSGDVIRFPARRMACIWLIPEAEGEWLVLAGEHGWAHGDYDAARDDARWLARNLGLPIRRKEAAS